MVLAVFCQLFQTCFVTFPGETLATSLLAMGTSLLPGKSMSFFVWIFCLHHHLYITGRKKQIKKNHVDVFLASKAEKLEIAYTP